MAVKIVGLARRLVAKNLIDEAKVQQAILKATDQDVPLVHYLVCNKLIDQYSLAVGSLKGTMGRLGAGITNVFNQKQSAAKLSVSPGGGRANPARLGSGGADFAFSFSNFTSTAIAGTAPFKKPYKNLKVIAKFWDSCYHQYIA